MTKIALLHTLKLTSEDRHFIRSVVTPSWLSGLCVVLIALIISGGTIIIFGLSHSAFKQDLLSWEKNHTKTSLSVIGQSTETVNPSIANSWPLIFIWGLIGLLTYAIAASVVHMILQSIQFGRELDYVHADRKQMLQTTIEHIALRLVAAILLVIVAMLSVYRILPYTINAAHQSVGLEFGVKSVGYALESFLLIAICVHAAIVLLRLSFGRARMFSRY